MSYTFDGTTGVRLDSSASLSALANTSFTMAVWCKPVDSTPTANTTAFSLGNSGSSSTNNVQLRQTAGHAQMASVQAGTDFTETADGDATSGQWFLMVGRFTVNGSNQVTAHTVNSYNQFTATAATKVDETLAAAKTMSTMNVIRVGQARSSGEFIGDIAHAAVWTKLLSDSEVSELYTKVPSAVANADLYVYWPLLTGLTETKTGGGTFDLTNTGGAVLNSGDGPTLSSGSSSIAPLAASYYYN